MAQRGIARSFLCRSCRGQLLKTSRSEYRSFSSTARRAKSIPSFEPTSSPELDEMLLIFRERLFTPWALQKQQRKLIWSPKNHQLLLNDPGITVELPGGDSLKLMPADPLAIPSPRKELHKILDLMKEPEDWKNLMGFLEGLKIAHQTPTPDLMEKIVRKAHESGMVRVIIECAARSDITGLSFKNPTIFEEVMLAYHTKAQKANWEGEEVVKALKQAEYATLMLEAKDHQPKMKEKEVDPRKRPEIVGILFELATARAKDNLEDVDAGKVVRDYAAKTLALWPNGDFKTSKTWWAATRQLELSTPVWKGIGYALSLDRFKAGEPDEELGSQLKQRHEELDHLLREARSIVESKAGKETRGLHYYKAALGE